MSSPTHPTDVAAPSRAPRGRGWQLLAAGCTAVLLALSVTSTALAQPTVTEGATNAQGDRLLAGADRYATAVLLAEVPLDAGDAATRDVLVVSGESLVDAVSAVSVAASRDAAIVLTATDAVPQVVAEFIAERSFDRVTVGGGTAAVSDTTAGELAALTGDANDGVAGDGSGVVRRVAGATRFETAVAAARAAGQPGNWCDTGYRGAVVVSGESLVDGVIAAPVAYAWRLPLLFTEADALPEVVAGFLRGTANVRHVTVVGAPTDVSDAVVRDIARANDVNVLRIDAATPAERSVELAEAVAHCRSQPVAPGQYALLDANQPVDGVAAAAALANGLGEHGTSETLIPILAVNQNSLPQPVADYLARVGRRHDTITLYPLGGVARLTPRVISRAVAAAEGDAEAGDIARLPSFAATVDLDGDGQLSYDELYPADTLHRQAYLEASGGTAPPGAWAPPVPGLMEVSYDRSRSERGRTSLDRYPNGLPSAPGSFDYATTTFEQRQRARAEEWSRWSLPNSANDPPTNTIEGFWNNYYEVGCGLYERNRELGRTHPENGVDTTTCEWAIDWHLWMCRVFNEPAVRGLPVDEQWITMVSRYHDTWVELVGRDRYYWLNQEANFPINSRTGKLSHEYHHSGLEAACSMRLDNEFSQANHDYRFARVAELQATFPDTVIEIPGPYGGRRGDAAFLTSYITDRIWARANPWYTAREAAVYEQYR